MDLPDVTLRQVAVTVSYLLLGVVGTAAVGLGTLFALQPAQEFVYDLVYFRVGPADATEFAILLVFLVAGTVALSAASLAGEYLSDRGANLRPILVGLGALGGLVVLFAVVSLLGLLGFPIAILVVLVAGLGVPLLLRFRFGVRSGALPAFVGGVPVVVLMLLLAGFGIGWGWGYTLTAEQVPASTVGDAEVASFDAVPQVRDDLFSGDCSGDTCYLYLRGYEHEETAVRFLAEHGVRCPYQGSTRGAGSFFALHDGDYYRVSCASHGD